jgi:hypothetical protein
VSDADRVYALFEEANPVPDPSLLPATRDEAALPTFEGSMIMDTRETTQARPTEERARGWKAVVAVAAAFIVVLVGVGGAILLMGGEGEPVAATEAQPIVTCDGEACNWDGPTTLTPGDLRIEFINDSPRGITFAVWTMNGAALEDQLANRPAGTDIALLPDDAVPDGDLAFFFNVAPGGSRSESLAVTAGNSYLVDCLTTAASDDGDYYDHLWRPAAIEVVEP